MMLFDIFKPPSAGKYVLVERRITKDADILMIPADPADLLEHKYVSYDQCVVFGLVIYW